MNPKEKKTNPKIRLGLLREDEKTIISNLKKKEKEINTLLAQLKAIRKLIAEAANELEVEDYEETIKTEIKEAEEERKIESLDELVKDVRTELQKTNDQVMYSGLQPEKIMVAANEKTISKLYELAYKSSDWTKEETKEFFNIRDAVFQVKNYDLSSNIAKTVDNVYKALQTVNEQKQEIIEQNYDTSYVQQQLHNNQNNTTFTSNTQQTINNNQLFKSNTFNNINDDYKIETKKINEKDNKLK